VDGQEVNSFTELSMLIFGDFKKHIFTYQYLCPAIPVEDYKVLSIVPACEYFPEESRADSLAKLNTFVKHFCN
jgi:hypothetical protein